MEREDGESPFILTAGVDRAIEWVEGRFLREDDILGVRGYFFAVRGCFVGGGLQFQVFSVQRRPDKATFLFNVKTHSALCLLFKQNVRHSPIAQREKMHLQIRKVQNQGSTLVFKSKVNDTDGCMGIHDTVSAYMEICECNGKSGETPQLPETVWKGL